jgi:hypothetical protein
MHKPWLDALLLFGSIYSLVLHLWALGLWLEHRAVKAERAFIIKAHYSHKHKSKLAQCTTGGCRYLTRRDWVLESQPPVLQAEA